VRGRHETPAGSEKRPTGQGFIHFGVWCVQSSWGSAHQSPRDVPERVAQPLGLGRGQWTLQAEALGLGQQVLSQHHRHQPDRARGELGEGEVLQPQCLAPANAILHPGMTPVTGLQVGDVEVLRVGDQALVS